MNKKGFSFLFQILLIVVMVILLIAVTIIISNKIPKFQKQIGENQENLAKLYLKGDKIHNYLKSSIDSVKNEALYEFEENGHYAECGKKENYALWKTKDKDCYPNTISVRKGFAKALLPKLNPLIQTFNFYDTKLQSYTTGDIAIENNEIIGYPFDFLVLSEEPYYSIPQSFSSEIIGLKDVNKDYGPIQIIKITIPKYEPFVYEFNYDSIKDDMTIVENKCESEENVLGSKDLEICALKTTGNINSAKRHMQGLQFLYGLSCEDYDNPVEAKLYKLAEQFNNCRNSYDNYCGCLITDEDMDGITISGKSISIEGNVDGVKRRYNYQLEEDFPPYALGKDIVKIDQIKAFEQNNPIIANINSICRYNDRTLKICASKDFEVSIKDIENNKVTSKKIKTKFAIEIDDKAKPKPVENLVVDENTNHISFSPSKSGDVKEYKIVLMNKDVANPDWTKATEYNVRIPREKNFDETISVDIESIYSLKGLNLKVIPIDFEGNEGEI